MPSRAIFPNGKGPASTALETGGPSFCGWAYHAERSVMGFFVGRGERQRKRVLTSLPPSLPEGRARMHPPPASFLSYLQTDFPAFVVLTCVCVRAARRKPLRARAVLRAQVRVLRVLFGGGRRSKHPALCRMFAT